VQNVRTASYPALFTCGHTIIFEKFTVFAEKSLDVRFCRTLLVRNEQVKSSQVHSPWTKRSGRI